jgi:hypothetical protein
VKYHAKKEWYTRMTSYPTISWTQEATNGNSESLNKLVFLPLLAVRKERHHKDNCAMLKK